MSNNPDEEVTRRQKAKEDELKIVFDQVQPTTQSDELKIAVLGCADRRYIPSHKELFERLLNKQVELDTYDISIEHLASEENVYQHDCTLPLPKTDYDITFAHVLLPFIETEKQWDLLKNSYDALKTGGIAIHIMGPEDYLTTKPRLPNGNYSIPLDRWKQQLEQADIEYKIVDAQFELDGLDLPTQMSTALILIKR